MEEANIVAMLDSPDRNSPSDNGVVLLPTVTYGKILAIRRGPREYSHGRVRVSRVLRLGKTVITNQANLVATDGKLLMSPFPSSPS